MFDFDKLLWFNGEYIHALTDEAFTALVKPFIRTAPPAGIRQDLMLRLLKTRVSKLSEINEKMSFFLTLPSFDKELFLNKKNKIDDYATVAAVLTEAKKILGDLPAFENDALFAALSPLAKKLGMKTGAVMWCVRIAVSGLAATPGGATEIMEVIGKSESLARIDRALAML